jgi:ABC-2 type transport system permease protein
MNSLRRLMAVAHKEIMQLRRDRLTFGMIVGIPLMLILLFGYAINTDVRHLPAAVADLANTSLSQQLVRDTEASQVIEVTQFVSSVAELEKMIRQGDIDVGIFIPPDFERRLQQSQRPAAQILVDGSDPLILGAARGLLNTPINPRNLGTASFSAVYSLYNAYNPEHRSAVYIVPGLIGVILTMTMVLFTSIAIVRERERGNLELLITTPVRTPELMMGKAFPYIIIGLIQATIIILVGAWLFRVPVNGVLLDIYLAALVFITANLSLGLLISTLARSQFQSMQLTFFVFLPSILLSGFMFPFEGMPALAQFISEALPLTHFLRLIRGIMLRGADLSELSPDIYALLIFITVAMTLAILRFRKRLD